MSEPKPPLFITEAERTELLRRRANGHQNGHAKGETRAEIDESSADSLDAIKTVSAGVLFDAPYRPDAPAVIENFYPTIDAGFLGGQVKRGKSYVMTHSSVCLSTGLPFFGRFRVNGLWRVVLLVEDDTEQRVKRHLHQILAGMGVNPAEHPMVYGGLHDRLFIAARQGLTLPRDFKRLEHLVEKHRPDLIIGDSLSRLFKVNIMDTSVAQDMTARLDDFTREYGPAFQFTHHDAKGGQGARGSEKLAGPFPWRAWAVHSLFFDGHQGKTRITVQSKDLPDGDSYRLLWEARGGTRHNPAAIRLGVESLNKPDPVVEKAADDVEALYQAIQQHPHSHPTGVGVKTTELIESLDIVKSTFWRRVDVLERDGRIRVDRGDGKHAGRIWLGGTGG